MTSVAVRVGELACQRQSFLRELVATVVSCEPAKVVTGGKNKSASANHTNVFEVVLSDSVLFPEGGGQPCDTGTLRALQEDTTGTSEVYPAEPVHIDIVERKGDTCVMLSPHAFPVGARVLQQVDWPRRLDHMQHHTGQHLLSAILEKEEVMHLGTESWSLTHPFSFIQVDVGPYLNNPDSPYCRFVTREKKVCNDMIQRIQTMCNNAIAAATSVDCSVFQDREAYDEAVQTSLNASENGLQGPLFRSRGIPSDVTGPIRLIALDKGQLDSCTCCGTHLEHLGQLHVLHILHQEVKGTKLKIHFITGERALKFFDDMYLRERALAAEVGCRAEDVLGQVQRRATEMKVADKKMARWVQELAHWEAERLSRQLLEAPTRLAILRRDDMQADFFDALRSQLDEAGCKGVTLVAAWAADGGSGPLPANSNILPAKDVEGRVMASGGDPVVLTTVVETIKHTLEGLKGGLSKTGFRGKGSLKEWSTLVKQLQALPLHE